MSEYTEYDYTLLLCYKWVIKYKKKEDFNDFFLMLFFQFAKINDQFKIFWLD
jgi:hypothetical protein